LESLDQVECEARGAGPAADRGSSPANRRSSKLSGDKAEKADVAAARALMDCDHDKCRRSSGSVASSPDRPTPDRTAPASGVNAGSSNPPSPACTTAAGFCFAPTAATKPTKRLHADYRSLGRRDRFQHASTGGAGVPPRGEPATGTNSTGAVGQPRVRVLRPALFDLRGKSCSLDHK
jgi:hypothetical protein